MSNKRKKEKENVSIKFNDGDSSSIHNSTNSKLEKIKDILFTDRGGTNSKKILSKIPYKYVEIIGFCICAFFMLFLIYEQVMRAFFGKSIMERMFYLGSVFAEIFAVFYMARAFVVEEKQKFSEFIKTHIWDILFFAMLVIACISAHFSEAGKLSFKGVMIRHDGFYSYVTYAAVYICSKSVRNPKLKRWIIRIMGITISMLSINTILQSSDVIIEKMGQVGFYICKYATFASIYFNINHFAYVLTIGIMALAVLVIIEEKLILKILWLVLCGYNVWSLIINNTFGCFIAVLCGMIFMAIVMLVVDKKRLKSVIAVLVMFVAVCVITDIKTENISSNFKATSGDVQTITTNEDAGSGRIGIWKQTIGYIKEKPLLGHGPEGLYMKLVNGEVECDVPHNEFLQHMLYMGIPAGLFYIIGLICLFITMVKKIKYIPKEMLAMGVVVFAYCVSSFFGLTLYNTATYYFMFLGGISACGMVKKDTES